MLSTGKRPFAAQLLTAILDALFPPSSRALLLRSVTADSLPALYMPGGYENMEFLTNYSHPVVQAAIIENKFNRNRHAARLLGEILKMWIEKQKTPVTFVPVPLGSRRHRERGHNQVETILSLTGLPAVSIRNLLLRSVETKPQSKLQRVERMKNLSGSFVCNRTAVTKIASGTRLVLLDDVVTTGATLAAARAALAPHLPPGVTLSCLAIAH